MQAFSQVQILADDVVLKVGNLAFSGAQLVAKTVKAIIDGTMTLESLQNEVISSEKKSAWSTHLNALGAGIGGVLQGPTTGLAGFLHRMNHTPLGMIPTIRQEDQQHVEKVLHEMAQFVGTEEFTLKVGQSLINRSAEVGLRVDGIVKDSGIDAKRVLNQPLQDVHIHKRGAVVVPLADTLALFGALNELTVLRRQAFDAMKEQGLSDREAVKVLNDPGVKKIMEETAKTVETIQERRQQAQEKFEKSAAEILKTYRGRAPEDAVEVESPLVDKGLPLEYVILKQSAKTEARRDLHQDMVELVQLQGKIEKVLQDHPKTVQVLKTALNGIEWIADRVTDGVAIAAGGAYGLATEGFGGIVSGAQAGLQVKETVGEATAFAINQIVDVATERYVNSAKTPQERNQFQNAINFFKNSSLSVFGLLGMRHFVKPGPVGKAYSTALRKSLESKAVVKDGVVYVGKKNVGRIEDMPTIRTFKKPTDATLRPEFQSNIFDREVMYQGAGTGYNYRVYQRNDIDWNLVRKSPKAQEFVGKTNLEAALRGYAPELADGSLVNLHHIGQNGFGPLAEVTTRLHSKSNFDAFVALHNQFEGKGHPNNSIDRINFNIDRKAYWQKRAENVSKE